MPKTHVYITHRHSPQCGYSRRERGWKVGRDRQRRGGEWGQRDFAQGDGCMMPCAGDVTCTLKTCMVLRTNVTPINSIKKNEEKHFPQLQGTYFKNNFLLYQDGGLL